MKTMIRLAILTCAAVLSLAACSSDCDCPAVDPIIGTWVLEAMDGHALPGQLTMTGGDIFVVNNATAVIGDCGVFNATYNGTINNATRTLDVHGTWAKAGSAYTIEAGWALSNEAIRMDGTVTVSGNSLTFMSQNTHDVNSPVVVQSFSRQ